MKSSIPNTAKINPSNFVIFGGGGDLSTRKIIPALFWRFVDKQIDDKSNIIMTQAEGYDIKVIDVDFDLETADDSVQTTVNADSTGTTLNVASTTGVAVGDFVVLTDSSGTAFFSAEIVSRVSV